MPATTTAVDLQLVFSAINAVGTVGVLVVMLVAFIRGDLVSRPVLDKILGIYDKHLAEITDLLRKLESERRTRTSRWGDAQHLEDDEEWIPR